MLAAVLHQLCHMMPSTILFCTALYLLQNFLLHYAFGHSLTVHGLTATLSTTFLAAAIGFWFCV